MSASGSTADRPLMATSQRVANGVKWWLADIRCGSVRWKRRGGFRVDTSSFFKTVSAAGANPGGDRVRINDLAIPASRWLARNGGWWLGVAVLDCGICLVGVCYTGYQALQVVVAVAHCSLSALPGCSCSFCGGVMLLGR
jgi:hypothetical protein